MGQRDRKTKSFKDNPALMFLSEAGEQESTAEQTAQETAIKAPTGAKAPAGYKYNPLYIETKTKRLQLVLQPSLYERIKSEAEKKGLSINEFCHQALDKATRKE